VGGEFGDFGFTGSLNWSARAPEALVDPSKSIDSAGGWHRGMDR
jgi:hypothetical protein